MAVKQKVAYTTKELGEDTWPDFEKFFEKHNGVAGGCWCMAYQRPSPRSLVGRLPRSIRMRMSRAERTAMNKRDKKKLVEESRAHGIVVYSGENPVGWCQYGLREELPRIDAGRNYSKIEPISQDKRLWRITCFFVDRHYRGQGVAQTALRAALKSIRRQGGGIVEAYPIASKKICIAAIVVVRDPEHV